MRICFAIVLSFVAVSIAAATAPGIESVEFIYESAPFPACHASTIVETQEGLVAAWFGGTHEKHPDVGIWLSRHVDGKWTAPVEVANGIQFTYADGKVQRHPSWNPVLFQPTQPANSPLLLFFKVGPDCDKWWGELMSSADCGKTWSQPRRLPDGIMGPIKNKPVQLANGDILCPTSDEQQGWRAHFERTHDNGLTWSRTAPINDGKKTNIIQPSILIHGDGKLQALCRDRGAKNVMETWSTDGGISWSEPTPTPLPNPNSGTDALTLRDGRHVLIYNHTTKGRSPLNLAISTDGKTWQAAAVLENTPGEYSYPAIIQTADGKLHATYTWKRQRIRHVVIDPTKLELKPIVAGQWPE